MVSTSLKVKLAAKRFIDVLGSVTGLMILSVPMAIVALAILATMGRPILFRQTRPGFQGRPFVLYKFRSMRDNRDSSGALLPNERRLTALGRFLRATSLDELPELWNVLKGDMSLVGPRPLRMEYLPLYSSDQRRRHDVKPGITGWAQIHGRNRLSWEERFRLDVWYVDNWTLWLDVKILVATLARVLSRRDVEVSGVPAFTGSSGVDYGRDVTHDVVRSACDIASDGDRTDSIG